MVDAPERIWARPDPATVYMDGSSPLVARDREFRDAVEYVRADRAEAERDRLAAENEALREALTPSGATKAAYIGEFHMGVTLSLGSQEEYRRIQIPWTSIKEIMAAIVAHAALDTAKGAEK